MGNGTITNELRAAGLAALRAHGYTVERDRQPGRLGPNQRFRITKGGHTQVAALRTTRDQWLAFVPEDDGTWRTLSEVDAVIIVASDRPGADPQGTDRPTEARVWLMPADKLVAKFDAGLRHYTAEGRATGLDHAPDRRPGFWRCLYPLNDPHLGAGSDLLGGRPPMAVMPLGAGEAERPAGVPMSEAEAIEAKRTSARAEAFRALIIETRHTAAALLGLPFEEVDVQIALRG